MKLFNTMSRRKEEFVPLEEGKVRMYVCGPTVYNLIHIGNARPMIIFDTVRRYLEYKGYEVNYVSNFTDVDDKIIKKAIEEGVSAEEISQRYIAECKKDMAGMNVKPVVAADTEEYAIREEDIPQIMEEYDALAKEMIAREKAGKGFNFFHFMIDLTGGPCVYKRLSGCGSGTEYLAVTPWGDFYPCHQFVGEEQFLMGNVDEGITHPEIRDKFGKCNVYTKEACKDCFARFYCSGGCAANAYHFQKDINGNYGIGCELQRKRVECAIMIKAALAE